MKSYTNLYPSPDKDYALFNEAMATSFNGLGDNHGFKRFGMYMDNEAQQKREINRKSEGINKNRDIYTFENIINPNDDIKMNNNDNFVDGQLSHRTIEIPFYVCLIDIIISKNIPIEIIDTSSAKTKSEVLICGNIRKYRINKAINKYNIFIEMVNGTVFHVNKKEIMMRVHVSEKMRQVIFSTMNNYVANNKCVGSNVETEDMDDNMDRGRCAGRGGCFSCFGCFKKMSE